MSSRQSVAFRLFLRHAAGIRSGDGENLYGLEMSDNFVAK